MGVVERFEGEYLRLRRRRVPHASLAFTETGLALVWAPRTRGFDLRRALAKAWASRCRRASGNTAPTSRATSAGAGPSTAILGRPHRAMWRKAAPSRPAIIAAEKTARMTSSRISNQNSAKTRRKKIWSTAGRSIRSARRRYRSAGRGRSKRRTPCRRERAGRLRKCADTECRAASRGRSPFATSATDSKVDTRHFALIADSAALPMQSQVRRSRRLRKKRQPT